jgi:hypothetical protein
LLRRIRQCSAFDGSNVAFRQWVQTPSRNEGKACSLAASFLGQHATVDGPVQGGAVSAGLAAGDKGSNYRECLFKKIKGVRRSSITN